MIFHLKDCSGVAHEGEMMKDSVLIIPTLRYMTHIAVLRLTHSN